jgi:nucleoside-diphosphate-sugar epimerase
MAQPKRNILVVGATGKQGGATVRHLLSPTSPPDFYVWALTRNSSSPIAKRLLEGAEKEGVSDRLNLIEGNLEDAARIREVFGTIAGSEGGIWGVFVAIAFPGLGVKDDRERDQGMVWTSS